VAWSDGVEQGKGLQARSDESEGKGPESSRSKMTHAEMIRGSAKEEMHATFVEKMVISDAILLMKTSISMVIFIPG